MLIKEFFHADTSTYCYVVADAVGGQAAVIDAVLDYVPQSAYLNEDFLNRICAYLDEQQLQLQWILETHAHADHVSAAHALQQRRGGRIAAGAGITSVQQHFNQLFALDAAQAACAADFDQLFADQEHFRIGQLDAYVLNTPGHTNDSVSYVIGDAAFVGDTLFMPDSGTARCDFPGGDARQLYASIQRLYALPAETRLFLCHDYQLPAVGVRHVSTVAAQRANNIHVRDGMSVEDFVRMRSERDKTLDTPRLLLPSIQMNIRAGRAPQAAANGIRYLRLPLNQLGPR